VIILMNIDDAATFLIRTESLTDQPNTNTVLVVNCPTTFQLQEFIPSLDISLTARTFRRLHTTCISPVISN
jgi:hypothetical protein